MSLEAIWNLGGGVSQIEARWGQARSTFQNVTKEQRFWKERPEVVHSSAVAAETWLLCREESQRDANGSITKHYQEWKPHAIICIPTSSLLCVSDISAKENQGMSSFALKLHGHSQTSSLALSLFSQRVRRCSPSPRNNCDPCWGPMGDCVTHFTGLLPQSAHSRMTAGEDSQDIHLEGRKQRFPPPALSASWYTRHLCAMAPSASGHNAAEYCGLQGR